MRFLSIAGDALWIIALSVMASGARAAFKRAKPDAPTPLPFAGDRRARPAVALSLMPAGAFVIGALLLFAHRTSPPGPEDLIWFCLRAIAAALIGLAFLRHLKAALETLQREGQLKP